MSSPLREKISCCSPSMKTYRSPLGPPYSPSSPSPRSRSREPVSTPAGILSWTVLTALTFPPPEHSRQGVVITLPSPRHWEQGGLMLKKPLDCVTWPLPWQRVQICGEAPGAQPDPRQEEQRTYFSTLISLPAPRALSMKEIRRS